MAQTTVRIVTPAYWQSAGRLTLAASALILAGSSALFNIPIWAALAALDCLLAVAWAVVWPERAVRLYPGAARLALVAAGAALMAAFAVSVLAGSPLLFGAWVAGIGVSMTVLTFVAPRER